MFWTFFRRKPLNEAIVKMKEKGYFTKLENKWWWDRSQCKLYDLKARLTKKSILLLIDSILYFKR